jgi:hypothetical protein
LIFGAILTRFLRNERLVGASVRLVGESGPLCSVLKRKV